MLAAVVAMALALVLVGVYAVAHEETVARGSRGPLLESAPRSDPAPTFMQPGTQPHK